MEALDALVRLCHDDADTRWCALYALVDEVTGADPHILGRVVADRLADRLADPDDQVRDLAQEHHHPGQHP